MSKKELSPELQDQLDLLAAVPDDQIDTTHIPEVSAETWHHARRPGLYRPIKKPVTLRLDVDIVAWFKEHTQDRGYQTEINSVLRRYVTESEARTCLDAVNADRDPEYAGKSENACLGRQEKAAGPGVGPAAKGEPDE